MKKILTEKEGLLVYFNSYHVDGSIFFSMYLTSPAKAYGFIPIFRGMQIVTSKIWIL